MLIVALCVGIVTSMAQDPMNSAAEASSEVYNASDSRPDTMPKFQGSDDVMNFVMWVGQSVKYPAEAIENGISGRVVVSFVVGVDGYVKAESVELLRGEDVLFKEVARVLAESPQWEPGAHEGKRVPVQFAIPVVFTL